MPNRIILRSSIYGVLASIVLLGIYFTVLSLLSGWGFAKDQFSMFWFFIVSLAIGFGVQIGLYTYLKYLVKSGSGDSKVLGVTGATSTATMISCCTHYLANLLPILGVAGVVTFVAQYQIQLFWMGMILNFGGILYMASKIVKYKRT